MRATVVAGLGGLVIGHMLWLVGIKLATNSNHVEGWVLVVAGVSFALTLVCGWLGWVFRRQQAYAKAAFAWGLVISPLLFSIAVLGVTYL